MTHILRTAIALLLLAAARLEAAHPEVGALDRELDGPGLNVDDPCFWVDPADPAHTLIFVTTKDSGLVEVFDLVSGALIGTVPGFGRPNNCAVAGDLLLTTDWKAGNVKMHHVPDLALVGTFGDDLIQPEGIDVLTTPEGQKLVYVTDSGDASVHVYDLVTGGFVRAFSTGFGLKIEPILADDRWQRIFVAREEGTGASGIGLFTPEGVKLDEFGTSAFSKETEGMALYRCGDGGYLVVSDQVTNGTQIEVFDRITLAHLGSVRLQDGTGDYTDSTDGIDILQTPIPGFPNGVLAACDGCGSTLPDEMDVVDWDRISQVLALDRCPGGVAPDCGTSPCIGRVLASADATVSQELPVVNLGAATSLELDTTPVQETLLRFVVPADVGVIDGAVVRLTVDTATTSDSPGGASLFATTSDWSEDTVTFANGPAPVGGPIVGVAGPVTAAQLVDFDVSTVVDGPGTYDFIVRGTSSDKARFRSREAGVSPPTLLIAVLGGGAPEVRIGVPIEGTAVVTGEAVALTATARDATGLDLSSAIAWLSDLDGPLGTGERIVVPGLSLGTHLITASVTGRNHRLGEARVRLRVAPSELLLEPLADTYVNAGAPLKNYGGDSTLQAEKATAEKNAYLRFRVVGAADLEVERAVLTLTVSAASGSGSDRGGTLHAITSTDWQERLITWDTRPPIDGPALASQAAVKADQVVEFDVTPAVTGDGAIAFALRGDSGNLVKYRSRENPAGRPALRLHLRSRHVADERPEIAITAPADGAVVGSQVTLVADARDEDGDLTSAVQWSSDTLGLLGTGSPLTLALPVGRHQLRAEVADQLGQTAFATIAIVVNDPPQVAIVAPAAGTSVPEGTPIVLEAHATDPQDGALGAIAWSSDRDGALGTGARITVALTAGAHVLTATATDAGGLPGHAEVNVVVRAGTVIMKPTADTWVGAAEPTTNFGTVKTLSADATPDREIFFRFRVDTTGGLPPARATLRLTVSGATGSPSDSGGTLHALTDTGWSETGLTYDSRPAIDGPPLGTAGAVAKGQVVDFDVTPVIHGDGTYVFALVTASDDGVGYLSRESASGGPQLLLVNSGVPSHPPTITITSPADGTSVDLGAPVTLTARANDPEEGDLSAAIRWSSDRAGALGTGASLTVATLPPGPHRLTATVTDTAGGSATATTGIVVLGNDPPVVTIVSPAPGALLAEGAPVRLEARVTDPEGQPLTAIAWSSDRQGPLGTGAVLNVALGAGTHVLTVVATDAAGLEGHAQVTVVVRGGTVALGPLADAAVSAAEPAVNFGTVKTLTADADPHQQIFFRFVVDSIGTVAPDKATLRLTVSSAKGSPSESGGTLFALTDTGWSETTLTYAGRPLVDGPALGAAGRVDAGQVVQFDVTRVVRRDGTYVFALVTRSGDGVGYASREATSGAPQLVLTTAGLPSAPPALAITSPADGTAVQLGTPLTLAATANDPEEGNLASAIHWTSDRMGALGTGNPLTVTSLSAGPHRLTATVTDASGNPATASVAVTVSGGALTLAPVADASVKSDVPDGNYGTSSALGADGAPLRRFYLRFAVQGLGGTRVSRATLRLKARASAGSGSVAGGDLHRVLGASWTESTITFATSPAVIEPILARAGAVADGQAVELDLTGAVTGDGVYDFVVDTAMSDKVEYASRESGADGPRLVLAVE